MRVASRNVVVVDVWIGDHRFVDDIEIDDDFSEIFRIRVRLQCWNFTGTDFRNALIRLRNQAFKRLCGIVHALVDHDLDARLGDLQRLDQRFVFGNADRRLGLHFGRPVGEGESLVGKQRSEMDFDDTALEHVVAVLLQHLRLRCVHNVAEVHVGLHRSLEGDLDRLRDRHGRLAGGERKRDGSGVRTEGDALGHAGVAVAADDDCPVINGDVVQHLVDHVCHGVIDALRITAGDDAEIVHEGHELRRVGLSLLVPDGRRVAAGLIGAVHQRRNDGGRHRFQFLRGHQTGRILRADDVDLDANVGAGVQHLARRHANGVAVENLLDGREALAFDRNFLVRCKDRGRLDAKRFSGKSLELLAEDDGVGAARLHEFHLLGREGRSEVDQLGAVFVPQLAILGVDLEDRAGLDRIFLLEDGVAVIVEDRLAVFTELLHPVLQIDADATRHVDGGGENGRNAVGARNDGGIVDEGHVGAGLLAGPQRHVIDARHARGANAHRALLGDHHHPLVGMLLLQRDDLRLRFRRDHTLAVQLAVGARMRLIAGRQEVGGNIAFGGNEGDDLDLVFDIRKLGEEFGLGVAFQHGLGDGVAGLVGIPQAEHVGIVKEDLGLQHFTRLGGDCGIFAERNVEQHLDRRAALHVRQQFQRKGRSDLRDDDVAEDDLLQKRSLHAGGARGSRQCVIDEKLQGIGAVFAACILDQFDDFGGQRTVIDRLGRKSLWFSAFDFSQVIQVKVHRNPNVMMSMEPNAASPNGTVDRPGFLSISSTPTGAG